jgi:hypothetical protein
VSKPPERYEPQEQVEDDYADDDYDTDESDIVSGDEDEDDSDLDSEDDADEDGNLDGFVVPDKSESDVSDSDGETPVSVKQRTAAVPVTGRTAVKKRPVRKEADSKLD